MQKALVLLMFILIATVLMLQGLNSVRNAAFAKADQKLARDCRSEAEPILSKARAESKIDIAELRAVLLPCAAHAGELKQKYDSGAWPDEK